ncbi:MAG: hypothetical protein P4L53_24385 [Candidatus Obscuribacterales bacterium]|nr:hypothetical protein [Candidatus Obscuribacterales bacterium]
METRLLESNLLVLASCALLGAGLSFPWHVLIQSNNQAVSAHTISENKHVVAVAAKVNKSQTNQKYLCISRKLTKASHHANKVKSRIAGRPLKTL